MVRTRYGYEQLFIRELKNPILTAAEWSYGINAVLIQERPFYQTARLYCFVGWKICAVIPVYAPHDLRMESAIGSSIPNHLIPDPEHHPEEIWGIEDPRITFVLS
jgi:hypothetical protein